VFTREPDKDIVLIPNMPLRPPSFLF